MPSMAGNGDVADYWLTCAGHSTKGASQTVATLVLKLVRAKEIFDGREDAVLRNILVNREDEWAGPHPASVVPLLSPVLMFLKTPTAIGSLPPGRSFAALHTLGCLPICINGVVDVAVKDFTVGLIDALLQLGFSDGPQVDRWTEVGHTIGRLARILEQSPEPLWLNVPPRAQPAVMSLINNPNLLMVDQDEEYDDDQEVGMDDTNEDTGIVNAGSHGAAVVDNALTSLLLDLPQVPNHLSHSLDPDPSLPSPQLFEAYIAAHLHASTSNQPPSNTQSDATGSILPPRASSVAPHTLSPLPSHSPSRSSSSPPRLSSSVLFPQPSLPVPSSSSSAPPASSAPPLSASPPPVSPLLVPASTWLDSRSAMQESSGVLGAAPSAVRYPPGSGSPAIAHGNLQESTSSHLTPLAVKLSLNNQTSPSGSSALLEDDVELDPAATEMQLYSPLEPSREVLSRSQADEGHKSPHFPELLSPCMSRHSSPVAMCSTPPSVLPDIGEGQPTLSHKDDEMSISSEDSNSSNEHTGGPLGPEMASAAQRYYMLESQRSSSIGTATRSVSIPPQSASRLELPGTILRASSLMPFDESAQPPSLDDLRPGSASLHAIREDEESLEYDKDEPLHEVSSSVEDDVLSGSISSLTEAEDGEESKAVSKPILRVLPNQTAREKGIEARKRNIEALGSLREPGRKQSKRARKARENRWKARSTGLEVEVEMEEGEEKEEEEEEEEGEEGEVEYEDVDEQQVRLNSPGTSGQQDDPRYHDDDDDGYESEDPIDLSGPSHQRGTVAASSSDRSVNSSSK
ncbi:hypothetical protein DL93DRAFT_2234684 [Clavulina sp. PMI_390]|nr:hypothetical protein DL93DRAFT_2234684 [Clavulina sp. PMI_390]